MADPMDVCECSIASTIEPSRASAAAKFEIDWNWVTINENAATSVENAMAELVDADLADYFGSIPHAELPKASGSPEGSSKVQSSSAVSTSPVPLVNAVRRQLLRVMFRSFLVT